MRINEIYAVSITWVVYEMKVNCCLCFELEWIFSDITCVRSSVNGTPLGPKTF